MKVAIFMVVIFMTYYSVAGSPPVTKNPDLDSKRLKNETDRQYKDRMFHLGIYTLPNSKNIIATVDEVKKLKSGLNQLKLELPSKRMRIRNEVKKSLLDLSDGANDNFKTLSEAVQKLGQKWREMRAKAEKHEQSILVLVGQSHELAEKATVKKLEASLQNLTEKVGIDSDGTQLLIKAHLDRIEKLEQSSSQQIRDNGRLDYLEELMLQSIQDSGRIFHLEQKLEQSSAQFSQLKQQLEQTSSQSTRDRLRTDHLEQQMKLLMSAHGKLSNLLVEPVERPTSSSAVGNVESFEMSAGVDMHTPPPVE
ncbi:hypothetical protein HDE_05006 [Halotydeus destructor]|nr:hypothetical protein HDE_05006 [Halotydeus destructor]